MFVLMSHINLPDSMTITFDGSMQLSSIIAEGFARRRLAFPESIKNMLHLCSAEAELALSFTDQGEPMLVDTTVPEYQPV